jgi:steroid 5-alpha reductase family enzyme
LPLVIPFSDDLIAGLYSASSDWAAWFRLSAAGIFATGLTMETLADNQIESHKRQPEERGKSKILRFGVWSIVRHPNYLGDALCHLASPLWNLGSGLFSPWQMLRTIDNYLFLRGIRGDK